VQTVDAAGQPRYWLIHHHANGAVSWRALAASMAQLCTRPVDLTRDQKDAAYEHLAAHYRELGIAPPPPGGQSPDRAYDLALLGRQAWLDSSGNAWLYVDKQVTEQDGRTIAYPIFENIETGARQIMHVPLLGRLTDHEYWGTRSTEDPQGHELLLQTLADQQRQLIEIADVRAGAKFSKQTKAAVEQIASSLAEVGRDLRRAAGSLIDQASTLRGMIATPDDSDDDDGDRHLSGDGGWGAPSDGGQQTRDIDPAELLIELGPERTRQLVSYAVQAGVQAIRQERFPRSAGPRRGHQTATRK
jgi:hypothetical protein